MITKKLQYIMGGLAAVVLVLLLAMFALRLDMFHPDPEAHLTEAEKAAKKQEELNRIFNERVTAYSEQHPDINHEEARKRVAMGLDKVPYGNVLQVKNTDDVKVLVNPYYKLPDNYQPADLTPVTGSGEKEQVLMRQEAAEAFERMVQDAANEGFALSAADGWRSAEEQNQLYTKALNEQDLPYADTHVMRSGHNDHQTGLAADIRINDDLSDLDAIRWYDYEYSWLLNHMADYGFITRYPDDKQAYTLIFPKSWHIRYVGPELAKYLKENDLTLDEYYGLISLSEIQPF